MRACVLSPVSRTCFLSDDDDDDDDDGKRKGESKRKTNGEQEQEATRRRQQGKTKGGKGTRPLYTSPHLPIARP